MSNTDRNSVLATALAELTEEELADIAKPGDTPERTIANLIADLDRAHQQRDTAERQQAVTFDALIAERKTSANLRAEVRRLQERGILKRLLRRVVG
jgi:ATP-dependent exoDNAse (exonuclease V) beta subunit